MQRVAATVTFADGEQAQVFAALPDRFRVQMPTGRFVVNGGVVRSLDGSPAMPADSSRVHLLAKLVDAAAFAPLHRAAGCERTGPVSFRILQPVGEPWLLRLRDNCLLPDSLTQGDVTARVIDYLRTATTWVAKTVELDGLGACEVRFGDGGVPWRDDFFRVPGERESKPTTRRMHSPGSVVEARSATPQIVDQQRALRLVMIADPGKWQARADAYAPIHAELVRQQQQIAGFPMLWRDDDAHWLAVPFRQRDGKPALAAPDDWRIRDVAAGRWLVAYPDRGDAATRMRAGNDAVAAALAAQRLTARGPITSQPFVHLHKGAPSAEKLANLVVRVAVPIE